MEQVAARFDGTEDFTLGIEEEFQLLDPATLELTPRFEELQQKAQARLGNSVRGELIASEIEICTGISNSAAEAEADLLDKRRQLFASAAELELTLGATGTHPFADWQDQRIIDTPHYRLIDRELRYCAWRNVTFGMHTHVGIRGRERMIAVFNAMRGYLPHLLALSANSPFSEGRYTFLHSARSQLFTKFFPRCGIPGPFHGWDEYAGLVETLFATNCISEPTEIWWSIRPHPLMGTLEVRICDCQGDVRDTMAVAALTLAMVAQLAADYDEGRRLPVLTTHEVEENFWRAIRHGLDGRLVDFNTRRELPAGDAIREIIDYSTGAQERLGLGRHMAQVENLLKNGNGALRQIRAYEASGDITAAFREAVSRTQAMAGEDTGASNTDI